MLEVHFPPEPSQGCWLDLLPGGDVEEVKAALSSWGCWSGGKGWEWKGPRQNEGLLLEEGWEQSGRGGLCRGRGGSAEARGVRDEGGWPSLSWINAAWTKQPKQLVSFLRCPIPPTSATAVIYKPALWLQRCPVCANPAPKQLGEKKKHILEVQGVSRC